MNWSKGALNEFQQLKTKTVSAPEVVSKPVATTSSANASTEQTSSKTVEPNEDSFDANINTDFAKFDEMFSPLINSDPDLKEHWTKLTQSCADAGLTSSTASQLSSKI